MTAPPAGGPAGPEIPRLLSAQFRAASITEFAYLTPRGEPLCWPVTPYWYPDRGILGISTGLGYPNKAYYARRHPRVAALFGSTLLQGDAVVLDDDLQANTDRYVREMRAKFLSARFGLNPISVKLLDFYLPRSLFFAERRFCTRPPSPAPMAPAAPVAPPAQATTRTGEISIHNRGR